MPLHVSSNKRSSSGGPSCINTSSGITHSGGWMSGGPVRKKQIFPSDWPARNPPTRVCYTRWCINTTWSSCWWALVARNMKIHKINTLKKSASSWSLTRITSRCMVNKIWNTHWLGQLVAGILPRIPALDPRAVYCRSLSKVELSQRFFLRELRHFPVIIISPMFHTHISFIHIARINVPLACPASFSAVPEWTISHSVT